MVALYRKLTAVLVLVSVSVYANILANGFASDDYPYILECDEIHLPFFRMLSAPYNADGLWRPLGILVHSFSYSLAGAHAWFYHLLNIAVHAAVVVLLFQLFSEMLGRPRAAFVAALLFAVHPLHTEAVTPAHSMELLPTLFLLAAWLFHWRGKWLAAAACFFAALGFKEMAVCFVLLIPLADWRFGRGFNKAAYAAYGMVLAAYLVMRWKVVGPLGAVPISMINNPLFPLPAPLRVANALHLAWILLGLHLYPAHLSVEYSYNSIPVILAWSRLAGWIAASAALLAVWLYFARRSQAIFLAGWIYLAASLVTSNILFPSSAMFGERWAYLSSAGFCLMLGLAYEWLEQRKRTVVIALLALIVGAAAVRTILRNRDWRDNLTLFSAAVQVLPQSLKAQLWLGTQYLERGDLARAAEHLNAAERISPDFPTSQQYLASLELRQGNLAAAERHLRIAMRSSAGYSFEPEVIISYASLQIQAQRYNEAAAILNSVMISWPGMTRAYSNRALLHYCLHQPDLARADAEFALRLNLNNTQAVALLERLKQSSN